MTLKEKTKIIQTCVGAITDGIYGNQTADMILEFLAHCQGASVPPPVFTAEFDERTEKNLATLHPSVVKSMRPFVGRAISIAASFGLEFKVICGMRNKADQEKARRSGASRASYGYSWHNYGAAIDGGLFKGKRYIDSVDSDLAWTVYGAISEVGVREYGMIWGGSWTSIVDTPHFHPARLGNTPGAADRRALNAGTWSMK